MRIAVVALGLVACAAPYHTGELTHATTEGCADVRANAVASPSGFTVMLEFGNACDHAIPLYFSAMGAVSVDSYGARTPLPGRDPHLPALWLDAGNAGSERMHYAASATGTAYLEIDIGALTGGREQWVRVEVAEGVPPRHGYYGFGRWGDDRATNWFPNAGVDVPLRRLGVPQLDEHALVAARSGGTTPVRIRSDGYGGLLTGFALRATPRFGRLVLGLEMAELFSATAPSVTASVGGDALRPSDRGAGAFHVAAIVGLRTHSSVVELGGELAVGYESVTLQGDLPTTTTGCPDTGICSVAASIARPYVEARARADIWLSRQLSLALYIGVDPFAAGNFAVGVGLGNHRRSYDGY